VEGAIQRGISLVESALNKATHGNVLDWTVIEELVLNQVQKVVVEVGALISVSEAETCDQVGVLTLEVALHESTNVVWVQHRLVVTSLLCEQDRSLLGCQYEIRTSIVDYVATKLWISVEDGVNGRNGVKWRHTHHGQLRITKHRVLSPLDLGHVVFVDSDVLIELGVVQKHLELLPPDEGDQ